MTRWSAWVLLVASACQPDLGPATYEDVQRIFDDECVDDCHEPGGDIEETEVTGCIEPGLMVDLHLADAYEATVNMPSQQLPSMKLVEPGAPDDSYLWHKLNDTHGDVGGCGQFMPFTDDQASYILPSGTRSKIEEWIANGAEP